MRTLRITSPYMRGIDVVTVQKRLGVRTDGVYGSVTGGAVKDWKWRTGYHRKFVNTDYTASDQAYMTGTKKRTALMKIRASRRAKKAPSTELQNKALHYMRAWAADGLKELPASSNQVPALMREGRALGVGWQSNMGWPWCAYSVMLAALKAGSSTGKQGLVDDKFNALYVPEIESLARAGKYGMRVVGWSEAKPGDFVTFNWDGGVPDHIGMLVDTEVGYAVTVEGNTSSGSAGSQSDGGGVYIRHRDRTQIQAIIRYS